MAVRGLLNRQFYPDQLQRKKKQREFRQELDWQMQQKKARLQKERAEQLQEQRRMMAKNQSVEESVIKVKKSKGIQKDWMLIEEDSRSLIQEEQNLISRSTKTNKASYRELDQPKEKQHSRVKIRTGQQDSQRDRQPDNRERLLLPSLQVTLAVPNKKQQPKQILVLPKLQFEKKSLRKVEIENEREQSKSKSVWEPLRLNWSKPRKFLLHEHLLQNWI